MGLFKRLFGLVFRLLTFVFAALLVGCFIAVRIPPDYFPYVSLAGMMIPFLIVINFVFLIGWVFSLRFFLVVPLLALAAGWGKYDEFVGFHHEDPPVEKQASWLRVMSFNVRWFDHKEKDVQRKIGQMLQREVPDVICFQEYSPSQVDLSSWKYRHVVWRNRQKTWGQAICSKYPILRKGNLDFQNTGNNAIWVDVKGPGGQTVRIYNGHFQSLGLKAEDINTIYMGENTDQVREKINGVAFKAEKGFNRQKDQVTSLRIHMNECPYPKVVGCDLNNTAFSYSYGTIRGEDMQDAFSEKGFGFGRTFRPVFIFPLRIDFILADSRFQVVSFRTIDEPLSDHNAVISTLELKQ